MSLWEGRGTTSTSISPSRVLDDGFEVRVLDSPAGETGAIRTTFDSESAGAAVDDVVGGRTSLSARDVGQRSFEPREDDERRIGEALFKAVFSDDVLAALPRQREPRDRQRHRVAHRAALRRRRRCVAVGAPT